MADTARDELMEIVGYNDEIADDILNRHAHELAEKIRNHGFIGPCCCGEGPDDAADLIDPECD
jgi:hypothetical protein